LFAPVSPSEDERVPPPDPEEDGIAITKIDPPKPRPVAAPPPSEHWYGKNGAPECSSGGESTSADRRAALESPCEGQYPQ
jgi:hypothetical protein